jgi:hypothetical protein
VTVISSREPETASDSVSAAWAAKHALPRMAATAYETFEFITHSPGFTFRKTAAGNPSSKLNLRWGAARSD